LPTASSWIGRPSARAVMRGTHAFAAAKR
jgi:hypothetical protein